MKNRKISLIFLFVFSLNIGTHVKAASSPLMECQKRVALLHLAMNERIQQINVPLIQKFLIDAYQKTGQTIEPAQVLYLKLKTNILGLSMEFDVNGVSPQGHFSGHLFNGFNSEIAITKAVDNTVYDSLGNLISPATEVTCTVNRNFQDELRIFNIDTNVKIGSIKIPSDDLSKIGANFNLTRTFPLNSLMHK